MEKLKVKLKSWQDGFIFDDFKFKFLKSSWATGKTLALILAGIAESERYDDNLGIIFRKEFTDLRDSTIKDFETYTGLKVNSSREIRIGKSLIMFRHIEELNNIQNVNLGWFGIEQGEELDSDEPFVKLMGRLRRKDASRRGYVIANACGHNWIYKLKQSGIVDPETNQRLDCHYEACTFDNSDVLTPDYISTLKALEKNSPSVYRRFVLNSDDESDVTDIIIPANLVRAATERVMLKEPWTKRIVSIDVARYGDDKTVFYAIENNKLIGREQHEKKDTMETVGRAILFANKHQTNNFAVDEIGVGAGVADRLSEIGHRVIFVNAAKSSSFPEKYYNTRAEIYAYGAVQFAEGTVQIDKEDVELIEQLSWSKYKAIKSNGLFQVEAKEDIKKRYGKSPDNADAFLNGLWAMQRLTVFNENMKPIQRGWVHPRFRNGIQKVA